MNKLMQKLLILLVGTGMGTAYAKHNVYIKVASAVDYNFDVYAQYKDGQSLHLYLDRKGNEDVLFGNLNHILPNTCTLQTPRLQGAYTFKDFSAMLTKADKEKNTFQTKDFLITINTVGGRIATAWDVQGEWIDSSLNVPAPVKIINASDWHLQIDYKQKEPGALREMTEFMHKADKTKVNFMEIGDSPFLTDMSLIGKYSRAGSWSDLVTDVVDSTQFNLKPQIENAKSLVKDWNKETLAIIIKRVGHSTIGSLVGKKWDVIVKVVNKDTSAADIAKAEAVVTTPALTGVGKVGVSDQPQPIGQPVVRPAKDQSQTKDAPGMQVEVVNRTNWNVKVAYMDANRAAQGKDLTKFETGKKAPQVTLTGIDNINSLKFIPGGLTFNYDAQKQLEELKKTNKYKNYKNDYNVVITITHIPQKAVLLNSWTVTYQLVRKKTNVVYNPELVLKNIGDQNIEFEYTMDGKTQKVTIPAKDKNGVVSQAVLANARAVTKLGALQDDFMQDLKDAIGQYDQLPNAIQAKAAIALGFTFFPAGLFWGNDYVRCGSHAFIDAGKQVPYTTLAVTRPAKKGPKVKVDPLPDLIMAGEHKIAIINRTDKDIAIRYKKADSIDYINEIIAPRKNSTLPVKDVQGLVFHVTGHPDYVPTLLEQAKAKLDPKKQQYIVFDITHVGSKQDTWVVRVDVRSYEKDTEGNPVISKEMLTMPFGGKIKQK